MTNTRSTSSGNKYQTADLLLLFLYIAVAATIIFRVNIEATGYLSPDSKAYLGLAQNLLDGHGFEVVHAHDGSRRFFSIWPVGYPVLIYLMAVASGFSVFWASKMVNLLFLLLGFLLLRYFNRQYAYLIASVYCSFTLLEVYSFTWSEAPFVFGVLYLAYLAHQYLWGKESSLNLLLIFFTCLFLFLIRYIGAFSVSVPAILACHAFYRRNYTVAIKLSATCLVLVLLMGLYLGMNYYLSGRITGVDRLHAETESAGQFILMLLQALLNEFLIIRKHHFRGYPDGLFFITTGFQLLTMGTIAFLLIRNSIYLYNLKRNMLSLTCFGVALLYLLAIISLRIVSHFDSLDYRLLAPFSFLSMVGITNYLAALPSKNTTFNKIRWITFIFFIISLLLNLPKQYLLRKLTELL